MGDIALEAFIGSVDARFAPLVTALDRAILSADPGISAAIKWRQLTYALGGDYHHWLCAIVVTKKAVSLRFHFGGLLDDPQQVFRAGASKFLRTIDYASPDDLDPQLVGDYVRRAMTRLEYFKANWRELQGAG